MTTTTLTVLLLMAVPVAGVYAFVWALCRIASIPSPAIPSATDVCWTCGKQIPADFEFCTGECLDQWDAAMRRAKAGK